MREVLRRHVDLLPEGCDLIFHPRRIILTIEFAKLEAEVVRILHQANSEAAKTITGASQRLYYRRLHHSVYIKSRSSQAENMNRILLATLVFYRRWISPALHSLNPSGGCRYVPTCSEYASIAIATPRLAARQRAGHLESSALQSFGRRGLDNVPPKSPPRASRATRNSNPLPPTTH